MDDIVERLREWLSENPTCMEAADEIEDLRECLKESNQLAADNFKRAKRAESLGAVLREDIAKTMWLAEYRRATGKERSITWYDVAEDDRYKYLYVADAIIGAAQVETKPYRCMAPSKAACAWPDCGCDPEATKVIAALVDQGWRAPEEATSSLTSNGLVGEN